jgi:signal peptidase II
MPNSICHKSKLVKQRALARQRWLVGLTSIGLLCLDQLTKYWALQSLFWQESLPIMPGVNFSLAFNYGAAFGMFASAAWQRYFLVLVACCFVLGILWRLCWGSWQRLLECWGLLFILGGALGNLLDRLRFGYVVDFIDCYYKTWHWYNFNVADVFISIGAACLCLEFLRGSTNKEFDQNNKVQ